MNFITQVIIAFCIGLMLAAATELYDVFSFLLENKVFLSLIMLLFGIAMVQYLVQESEKENTDEKIKKRVDESKGN